MDMNSKKGDTNYLWIIVGIIIIVAVLGLYFFVGGKGISTITDWFKNLISPVNIDTVKAGCISACSTSSQEAWCSQKRQVSFLDDKEAKQAITLTCERWASGTINIAGKDVAGKDISAINIASLSNKVESCASVSC